mmetsp:Transcript_26975/g.40833  ORF Transcript_26975/g.40833 Transcript_26975/m.40833 type:complete len:121 (-) Transcript_26975:133-495(-)|eukprot:CAMPEP_0178905034 /NCGR_PEP_ID=MMETSP0786-20121207/6032_1 /TAXON_ID=186022 /ORGANISM="Thalassionema frauenfeldii, Strain CCMP 1798" /LENGTH=120 /DNA_ID=CAMNT_0020576559 /DNA_START=39 /DNA_END=401 /DNA_ORIENTATION=+
MVVGGVHRKHTSVNVSKNASWDEPPLKTQPNKLANIFLKKAPEEDSIEECNIAACGDVELLHLLSTKGDSCDKDCQFLHPRADLEIHLPRRNALSVNDMAELCQIEQKSSIPVNRRNLSS